MKTLDRKFTDDELFLIGHLLSNYCGELSDQDDSFYKSKKHKELWALQSYFNDKYNEIESC